jgi:tRNA(Ser,Leu) C12 N-acetylase TAN1
MRVVDIQSFLEAVGKMYSDEPELADSISRVMPVFRTFGFQTVEEFETGAREEIVTWSADLAGKSFYIRVHRRGFKAQISSHDVEKRLSETLLEKLETSGMPGRIDFGNPDAVIAVETVGTRAGLSLWSREDLARYPFLKVK